MFNLKQYRENEEANNHTENYLALAKEFGTADDVDFVERVLKVRNSRGFIYPIESDALNSTVGPYYKILVDTDKRGWRKFSYRNRQYWKLAMGENGGTVLEPTKELI